LLKNINRYVDYLLNKESVSIEKSSEKDMLLPIKKAEFNETFINKKNGKVFLSSDKSRYRDVDLYGIQGDNSKIKRDTGWTPTLTLEDICSKMISYDIKKAKNNQL